MRFLKSFVLLSTTVFFLSCSGQVQKEDINKPNIVFIFTDDLGYGDIGCFGANDIKTPNIDRIADEGIKFTEFYSASPICSPSRAGLLTGRMPQRMGINGVFFPDSYTGMSPDEVTIAEVLKEQGYATGIIGKWHLGHRKQFLPLNQGFDEYFGIPYSNDMTSVVYMRGNEVEEFHVDQSLTTKTYTKEALSFIDKHAERPFYLYIAHSMPHVPIYASDEFLGTSGRGLYGDVIQEIDWSVGQVIGKLKGLGLLENTLIVFSSDNGPWLVMKDHGGSAGNLREGKGFTFEGGVRVPTVAMWKGFIPAGVVYDDMATQMDWFPTFSRIANARLDNEIPLDGSDITDVLLGNDNKRQDDAFMYYMLGDLRCFRKGDWKVKLPYKGHPGSIWTKQVAAHDTLVFNLKEDPGETNNLYISDKVRALHLIDEMVKMQKQKGLDKLPPSLVIRTPVDNSHFEHLYED